MNGIPVIAIFDIGKTNKKLFLFDTEYKIVYERSIKFEEIMDEEGDPCEDLQKLRLFVYDSLVEILKNEEFYITAINFSTYGASFVYIDENGETLTPLYNYLKHFPEALKRKFYDTYGGEHKLSIQTCSPAMGNLNSGMQLYRLKEQKASLYKKIKYALHLPQYLSYSLSGHLSSDMTSIGCHTNLWDFQKRDYHEWVYKEGVNERFPVIQSSSKVVQSTLSGSNCIIGIGIHDSSAALIPYLLSFKETFILISTVT